MTTPLLLSIQIGLPKHRGREDASNPMERPWLSGIFKEPVQGPIWLGRTNLVGDGQADLKHHGGPDRAILGYAAEHYLVWRKELQRPELAYGSFGENFTLAGLTEESVCIGDTYTLGEVRIQVSQPRMPCWKLARRLGIKDITARVHQKVWGGWYFRVLTEGYVEQNLPLALLDRPFPQWTVTRAYNVMDEREEDPQASAELATCSLLSVDWRRYLLERVLAREA